MGAKRLYSVWIVAVVVSNLSVLVAQPGNPGSGPIGGIVYLLLAGLGFGVYSLTRKKKNN